MDVLHHLVKLCVNFLSSPDQALGVLRHLETGDADTASVDSLRRSDDHMLLLTQEVQSVVRGGHVGNLDVILDAGLCDLLCGLHLDVVLHRSGHVNVNVLDAPALLAGNELDAELVSIRLAVHRVLGTHLKDEVELFVGDDAVRIMDIAVGTCEVGDLGTEHSSLLHDAPAHVAVAGNGNALALDGVVLVLQDFLEIIDSAVAGRFRTNQGAAVAHALAGENAVLPDTLQAAVLAVQVADLAAANAHVTSGNVDVGPDVAVQSGHEALAESLDFCGRFAGGVEVGAALCAAHGQAGQRVLEGLLEAEELDNAFVDVLLEAQAALVRADGAVELAAPAAVGVIFALVVHPADAEGKHTLGLNHSLQQVDLLVLGMCVHDRGDGRQNFLNGLNEFRFIAVGSFDIIDDTCYVSIHFGKSSSKSVSSG